MKPFLTSQNGLRIVGFVVGLAIFPGMLLTSCSFLPAEEEKLRPPLIDPVKIEYKTEAVKRGNLIAQLRLYASLYPELQESLSFNDHGGYLKKTSVRLGDMVNAGDLIAELDSSSLASQIAIQELEVEKCILTVSQLRENNSNTYNIRRAELELKQQEVRLNELKRQLAATQIIAPFNGQITYLTSTLSGEFVNVRQTIAVISDTRQLVVLTRENSAARLPLGASVIVEYQTQRLPGKVIANPASQVNSPNPDLKNTALIRLDQSLPEEAHQGDTANIIYVLDQREDVVIISRSSINVSNERRYVHVLEDGIRFEKDVEVGLTTDTQAEIISGLEEGDLVIVN